MTIVAQCTNCGKKYKVAETSVGKQVRCQACQTIFVVQQPAMATSNAAAARSASGSNGSDQMKLAKQFGLAPLPQNPNQVFPEQTFKRRPGQPDPLANHVVYDPGFAPVSVADYHATQMPKEQSMHDYMREIEEEEGLRPKTKKPRQGSGLSSADQTAIGGGILSMVGAVVWLVVGLYFGYLFYYPPVLFVLGLVAVIKGLMGKT